MRLIILGFLFCSMSSAVIFGQSAKAFEKAGDKVKGEGNLGAALYYYENAAEIKPEEPRLLHKCAETAHAFQVFEVAKSYYSKLLDQDEYGKHKEVLWGMAKVEKSLGNYEEAIRWLKLLKAEELETNWQKQVNQEIADCTWALEQIMEANTILIEHLDKKINSRYSDFAPQKMGDSLIFSTYKYEFKEDKHRPKRRLTKIVLSKKNRRARPLRRGFNFQDAHSAHLAFSKYPNRIYFTKCEFISSANIRCALYSRERKRERSRWGSAKRVGKPINLKGFTTTHPNIVWDSTRQKEVLYFVSDRPGGAGGLDIWMSELDEEGNFSEPVNLKSINTSKDDITPFFHKPSQTLYFSSEGYSRYGGFDIVRSMWVDSTWSTPVLLDYPVNTSYNDLYYSLDADSTEAYFASNRLGSRYLNPDNKTCCNDIYRAVFPEPLPPPEEDLVDSTELVAEVPVDTVPLPKELETLEDFLPLALYFHNDEPDRRSKKSTTKKTYTDTYYPYYEMKEEYIEEYTRPLEGESIYEAEDELDDFFEEKVRKGFEHLNKFSEILLSRLENGDEVEIFIKGFTSPRAQSDYNLALGKRRISSLLNHFASYRDGIFAPYLQSRQLILSERSFGEEQARKTVSDQLEDKRNSIYSVEAAVERRVEIVEIR